MLAVWGFLQSEETKQNLRNPAKHPRLEKERGMPLTMMMTVLVRVSGEGVVWASDTKNALVKSPPKVPKTWGKGKEKVATIILHPLRTLPIQVHQPNRL
jgi:hypothetical protein